MFSTSVTSSETVIAPTAGILTSVPTLSVAAQESSPNNEIRVMSVDNNTVWIGVNYNPYLQAQTTANHNAYLSSMDTGTYNGDDYRIYEPLQYTYRDSLGLHRKGINTWFDTTTNHTITDVTSSNVLTTTQKRHWIKSLGKPRLQLPNTGWTSDKIMAADILEMVTLDVSPNFIEGHQYVYVATKDYTVTFSYSEYSGSFDNVAFIIPQTGYYIDNTDKNFSLMFYPGPDGQKINFSPWLDDYFYIVDADSSTGAVLTYGQIVLKKQDYYQDGGGTYSQYQYGGDVYGGDFIWADTANIFIYIPGIGRSPTINISHEVYNDANYKMLRFLSYQLAEEKTTSDGWNWPVSENLTTYKIIGGPNEFDRFTWYNSDGNTVTVLPERSTWKTLSWTGDKEGCVKSLMYYLLYSGTVSINVPGAYVMHDASDYDGRIYHTIIYSEMLDDYMMFPENFTVDQFNLPYTATSPNSYAGIPDWLIFVDHAMEGYRPIFELNGGFWANMWSGRTSAEYNTYGVTWGSLQARIRWGALAAKTAVVFDTVSPNCALAQKWEAVALEQYNYYKAGTLYSGTFRIPSTAVTEGWVTWSYKEATNNYWGDDMCKLTAGLYVLNPSSGVLATYTAHSASINTALGYYSAYLAESTNIRKGYNLIEFLHPSYNATFVTAAALVSASVFTGAELIEDWMANDPAFDFPMRAVTEVYSTTWSWGARHAAVRGKVFAPAYRYATTTAEKGRWLSNAAKCMEWQVGKNPLNLSWITGVGNSSIIDYNHHVSFLNGQQSWSDYTIQWPTFNYGIREYIHGGIPYGTARVIDQDFAPDHVFRYKYTLTSDAISRHQTVSVNECLMPSSVTTNINLTKEQMQILYYKTVPFEQRFIFSTNADNTSNEFTVNESVGAVLALSAMFMQPNYAPSTALKNYTPKTNWRDNVKSWIRP
jgi:hypothetical protein